MHLAAPTSSIDPVPALPHLPVRRVIRVPQLLQLPVSLRHGVQVDVAAALHIHERERRREVRHEAVDNADVAEAVGGGEVGGGEGGEVHLEAAGGGKVEQRWLVTCLLAFVHCMILRIECGAVPRAVAVSCA